MLSAPQGRGNRAVAVRQLTAAIAAGVTNAIHNVGAPFATYSGSKRKDPPSSKQNKPKKYKSKGFKIDVRSGLVRSAKGSNVTRRRKKRSLKDRITKLEKFTPKMSLHDWRKLITFQVLNAENLCAYGISSMLDSSNLEQAIDDLQFIDRGATPALDKVNITDLNRNHEVLFTDLYSKLVAKNNGHLAVECRIYQMLCVCDTSTTPLVYISTDDGPLMDGATDGLTNPITYPSDFKLMFESWKIIDTQAAVLNPGDELTSVYKRKIRKYNPEYKDNQATSYVKGDTLWMVRLVGTIAHGVNATENIGLTDGGVDCLVLRKAKVRYQGDASYNRIEADVTLATMTGGAEQAGPTVADHVDTV